MTNFPPPDYDNAVGAHLAPTTPSAPIAPPAPPAPSRSSGKRVLGVIAALALVLGPAVVGYRSVRTTDSSSTGLVRRSRQPNCERSQSNGSQSGTARSRRTARPAPAPSSSVDLEAIRDKVDDSIVNINTTLSTGGAAAGTGILIS